MKLGLASLAMMALLPSAALAQPLPCALTDADYQALANAKAGRIEPADIESMSAADRKDLCRARRFVREARGKDPQLYAKTHTADDVPIQLARFTTAEEYKDVYPAGLAVMLPVIESGPSRKPAGAGPAGGDKRTPPPR
jgi:hypothetical protein